MHPTDSAKRMTLVMFALPITSDTQIIVIAGPALVADAWQGAGLAAVAFYTSGERINPELRVSTRDVHAFFGFVERLASYSRRDGSGILLMLSTKAVKRYLYATAA